LTKFTSFDDNCSVIHIGDLFRYTNREDLWYIKVWFRPFQKKNYTLFSNLPALARGRVINRTFQHFTKSDRVLTFRSSDQLHSCLLSEFPELDVIESVKNADGNQHGFYWDCNRGDRIIVPQIELARSIFLVSSYLCRSSLSSTSLHVDFDVQIDHLKSHADIYILKNSSFPHTSLKKSMYSSLLGWLLTNSNAMASYQSIYKHYVANSVRNEKTESWRFSFDPPRMSGWKLHTRGRYSGNKAHYLIDEILGIEFDVDVPKSIAFHHPDFVNKKSTEEAANSGKGGTKWSKAEGEFEIDDTLTASGSNEPVSTDGHEGWIKFSKPFEVYRNTRVSEVKSLVQVQKNEKNACKVVSTAEPHHGGVLPAADLGTSDDDTSREKEFASRFTSFDHMIQILVEHYHCVIIHQEICSLQRVGKSKLHRLSDTTPRVIKTIHLNVRGKVIILLEVDTSDGLKMVSTRLVKVFNHSSWEKHFSLIRKGIVENSISWPIKLFDGIFGKKNHIGIHHPKHQGADAGNIPLESIEGWASRVMQAANSR